jgi:hypothetical protein
VWFGPYVALPRGRYEGVFELAVERNGASDQAVIKLDIVGGWVEGCMRGDRACEYDVLW